MKTTKFTNTTKVQDAILNGIASSFCDVLIATDDKLTHDDNFTDVDMFMYDVVHAWPNNEYKALIRAAGLTTFDYLEALNEGFSQYEIEGHVEFETDDALFFVDNPDAMTIIHDDLLDQLTKL